MPKEKYVRQNRSRLKYEVITMFDNPVLVLNPQTDTQIQFGVEKAKVILSNIPVIMKFVETYSRGAMPELYDLYFANPKLFKETVKDILEDRGGVEDIPALENQEVIL